MEPSQNKGRDGGKKRPKRFTGKQKYVNNNAKAHPRNKFAQNPPNFQTLSQKHPELAPFLTYKPRAHTYSLDWKDQDALKTLTTILLKEHYQLTYWNIPSGYLCPTVTNRANYIHWIQDLLIHICDYDRDTCDRFEMGKGVCGVIKGLDVGIGANCIYPIIGYKEYGWKFVGSDVNPGAVENAEEIVEKNGLGDFVEVRLQGDSGKIFDGVVREGEKYHFTMCNPPFFDTTEKIGQNPTTSCTANEYEGATEGGEGAFINKMIDESEKYKDQVVWFTTMFGRKQSFKECGKYLSEKFGDQTQVLTTELCQGKTTRWAIAWRFIDDLQGYMVKVLEIQRQKRRKVEEGE